MSDIDQAQETPLVDHLRDVPKDLRAEWEIMWMEDGTPCGHTMAPIGRYCHQALDRIQQLEADSGVINIDGLRVGEDMVRSYREIIEELKAELSDLKSLQPIYESISDVCAIAVRENEEFKAQLSQHQWVRVDEKGLPTDHQPSYLVKDKRGNVHKAYLDGDMVGDEFQPSTWIHSEGHGVKLDAYTHWMECPVVAINEVSE